MTPPDRAPFQKGIVKSMGLVFGDIGTSPIYTLTVIFLLVEPTFPNIIGVLSLILWTLVIVVTIQYAFLAMQLGYNGEGGTIVLRELLTPLLGSRRAVACVGLLSIIGVSLMIGDCIITPAISILSAVEGFRYVPEYSHIGQDLLLLLAAVITIGLFYLQKKGSERVAAAFGPLMLVWFSVLLISGLLSILSFPSIMAAINPLHGIRFLLTNGFASLLVLSSIILCATGAEALFADMGHLGKEPIRRAWYVVFFALAISYLGQGAYLASHPGTRVVLFEMIFSQAPTLYIPFLLLAVAATVIASQAVISGIFSIVYQAINTRMLPLFRIKYTSSELRTQVYIDNVNWFLCIAVLYVLLTFQYSENLAGAYGLAVTGTMTITGTLMALIFFARRQFGRMLLAGMIIAVDMVFLLSTTLKIPHGAYLSLFLAAVPFSLIMIYIHGQQRLYLSLHPMEKEDFLQKYQVAYHTLKKIRGTALFFARTIEHIPTYITNTIFQNNILYEDNVIVSVNITEKPFGMRWWFDPSPGPGLRVFCIEYGYMQMIDLRTILKDAEIHEKAIFYGMEEIMTDNILWKIFNAIKRLTPSFVQYYKLPANKIHGVITRIEM